MSKERELLKRVRDTLHELKETHYTLYWDIQSILDQPEQEPEAWLIINKVTGYRKQVAYKPANRDQDIWDILPMYLGTRVTSALKDSNTQYLLEEVSRLRAENVMIKEKWLTKEDKEDMLEENGYNRSDWWGRDD
jgi:hypothetical protein